MAKRRRDKRDKQTERELLATLTPAELDEVNRRQGIIDNAAQGVRMMVEGQQVLWTRLRTKYRVVGDFDFDPKQGKMYSKPGR